HAPHAHVHEPSNSTYRTARTASAHRRGSRRTAPTPHGHRTHPAAPRIGRSVPRSAPPARSIQWRARPRPVRASRPSVPCLALPAVLTAHGAGRCAAPLSPHSVRSHSVRLHVHTVEAGSDTARSGGV